MSFNVRVQLGPFKGIIEKLFFGIIHHAEIQVNTQTRRPLSSPGSNNLKLMKNQVSQWGLVAK